MKYLSRAWLVLGMAATVACGGSDDAGHDAAIDAGPALPNTAASKRVIYYDQTIYHGTSSDPANYVSLAPLGNAPNVDPTTQKPYVTDIIVAAFHLGAQSDGTSLHLNDDPPDAAIFDPLWSETSALQAQGVNILAMLGGAARGSYASLFDANGNLTPYYDVLTQALKDHHFNGIDLDIEESLSLASTEKLITRLRADFGTDFVITMAPVARALQGGTDPFSGFDYGTLYQDHGADISWFNVQFYSGFGSLSSTTAYTAIVNAGFPADKIVGGMLGSSNDGSGFVQMSTVQTTITALLTSYPDMGGVDCWEYFDAAPGGTADPAMWGTQFGQLFAN
jgi:hypothetical protein